MNYRPREQRVVLVVVEVAQLNGIASASKVMDDGFAFILLPAKIKRNY